MSQSKLLKKVIEALDNTQIEYMVTGSIVSSLQGQPRSTHDIDLVVALKTTAIDKLLAAFPAPQFYLNRDSIVEAIQAKDMFNLLEADSGDKVDFWILTDSDFDQSRFSRKYLEEFDRLKIYISTPEDTILAKLRWARLSGGSEKHFTDALRVYELQSGRLDMDYLNLWAKKLDVQSLWHKLQEQAETM
jgi:hypothetical protein